MPLVALDYTHTWILVITRTQCIKKDIKLIKVIVLYFVLGQIFVESNCIIFNYNYKTSEYYRLSLNNMFNILPIRYLKIFNNPD